VEGPQLSHRRNFSQQQPVNRCAGSRELLLKFTLRQCHPLCRRECFRRDQSLYCPKIFGVISGDVKQTARCERQVHRADEFRSDGAPAMMSPLRPRVWKQQVHGRYLVSRNQTRHGVNEINAENARVRQTEPRDSAANRISAPGETFDAEKIPLWILSRQHGQKSTVAAAAIDLDGRIPAEDFAEVEWLNR